jgi:rhodanese-related sulfurtransferase
VQTVTGSAEHWDQAYGHGDTTRSWFQSEAALSLTIIDRAGVHADDSLIDVGGGSSPLAADLLVRGHSDITVLDISLIGMRAAQQRLGAAADHVEWLHGDVRTWVPPRRYRVWHDRALFHFMTTEQDREAYLRTLESATKPEGAVAIFATFAPDGPPRCSGLPVRRYSAAELAAALGASWRLIEEGHELHTTPGGVVQPFTWTAFRRVTDQSAIDQLLAKARAGLDRVEPEHLAAEEAAGAILVDIRPVEQRQRDGELPGAIVIDRNVLEWRLDPTSPNRLPVATEADIRYVVVCNEGYSSSLAAATLRELGLNRATDLVGGFQALEKLDRVRGPSS